MRVTLLRRQFIDFSDENLSRDCREARLLRTDFLQRQSCLALVPGFNVVSGNSWFLRGHDLGVALINI
ncbi:MAG TPA: hypothetical protein VE221_06565 [Sphingomicrobium sp.]|nr:hypothetical protein [Sphingomicrobium sp.]